MTKKNWILLFLLGLIFAAIFYYLIFDISTTTKQRDLLHISVIVRGKDAEEWATMKQGIDQAAIDFNVDVSFITLSSENDVVEQALLIEREIANGADALLVSAADARELPRLLGEKREPLPVVFIESPVENAPMLSFISADGSRMGELLVEQMLRDQPAVGQVMVLSTAGNCKSIKERELAVTQSLTERGVRWEKVPVATGQQETGSLPAELLEKQTEAIVAVDPVVMQRIAETLPEFLGEDRVKFYGIGSGSHIAAYLEQEILTAVVVPNDYSIGYLGIKSAVEATEGKALEKTQTVTCQLITPDTMYEPANQKILFPYVRG